MQWKAIFFNLLDAHNNSYNLSPLYVLWVSEILFNILVLMVHYIIMTKNPTQYTIFSFSLSTSTLDSRKAFAARSNVIWTKYPCQVLFATWVCTLFRALVRVLYAWILSPLTHRHDEVSRFHDNLYLFIDHFIIATFGTIIYFLGES